MFLRTDLDPAAATEVAILPYVLRHGTRRLPSMRAVNRHLESLYGGRLDVDVLKLGEQQVLTFRLEVLGDAYLPAGQGVFEPGLALLRDLLLDPARGEDGALLPAPVAQEKEKLQRFIEGLVNDKGSYAAEACIRHMCAGEPYAVFEYGALADLPAIDGAALDARRRRLLETAPIDVYASGAVDPERIEDALREVFDLERRDVGPLRGTSPHPDPLGEVREVREAMQVRQAKMVMGYRADVRLDDRDYWAFLVMNGILGGFPHSKLFRNVREKEGLCYDASSSYERFKGLLFVSAGIDGDAYAKARELCHAQLEAIARGEIDDDELAWTRRSYQESYRALLDAPTGLINLDYSMGLGGRSGAPADGIEAVAAVDADAVRAAAERVRLDTVYLLEPDGSEASEEAA